MTLLDVIFKLIEQLGLLGSESLRTLRVDFDDHALKCTEESENMIDRLYAKLHKSIWIKALNPFLFFFLLKEAKSLSRTKSDDIFDDED